MVRAAGLANEGIPMAFEKDENCNNLPVETAWGKGAGGAVVAVSDLRRLLRAGAGELVAIECLMDQWRCWPDASPDELDRPAKLVFKYYQEASWPT